MRKISEPKTIQNGEETMNLNDAKVNFYLHLLNLLMRIIRACHTAMGVIRLRLHKLER